MKSSPATMLNTTMVVQICIAGTLIFMRGKYFVAADKSIDSNVPAPNVNNVNVRLKDATQRHITSKFVGGFHTPSPPSKRLYGDQILSHMTKPPKNIINKHASKSNYYGYRYKGSSEKSIGNPILKEHVGASDSYSTSKRIHYNSPPTHRIPCVSSFSKREQRSRPKLSSSLATTFPRTQSPLVTELNQKLSSIRNRISSAVPIIDKQDLAIVAIYVCSMLAISIPIILLPMIAADPFLPNSVSHSSPKMEGPAFVGAIVSLSTLGASVGKFANGFVCKSVGGRAAGSVYLLGLAAFSLLLSTTTSLHGVAIAGMEFCASIMWTACSVIFANRYERDPQKFSAAIMMLSLASTSGALMAKVFGTVLLSKLHWRQVALISSIMAFIGSAIMYCVVKENPRENRFKSILWANGGSQEDNNFTWNMISESASRVLSNRAFWMIGLAHATSFIARSSDKLMGSFVRDITGLPAYFCGSLTSSITIGFVIGLISGRKILSLESLAEKRMFTSRRYQRAVFSAVGLALCANRALGSLFGSTLLAVAITLISGVMAHSVAFQFYQFPTAFGSGFGNDKAVCISFLDGIACLIVSPIWSMVGKLVISPWVGSHGWSIAWLVIAGFFGIGGNVMMKNLSSVMP